MPRAPDDGTMRVKMAMCVISCTASGGVERRSFYPGKKQSLVSSSIVINYRKVTRKLI